MENEKENNKVHIKPFIILFLISIIIFAIIYFLHSKNIENRFNDTLQNYEKSINLIFENAITNNGSNENIYSAKEDLKLSFEVGFKMLESSMNEIMKNSNDILQFWFAFLSVIMIVFTLIGFFLNNNILNQAREQLEIIKDKSEILIQGLENKYNSAIKDINKRGEEESKKLTEESDLFNLGLQAHNNKDYKTSKDYFTKVINLNIKNSVAYYNRGLAKYHLKDYKGAIGDCNEAIRLNPNYSTAHNNRGLAKYYLKDYKGAVEDYNKAIILSPNYSLYYNNRGLAKLQLLEIKDAIKDFIKSYELDNDNKIKEKSKRQLIKLSKQGHEAAKKFCEEHNIDYKNYKE
ncbi:tetratricopeptide repeat protein [uncultured Brachyspira sp.]|uniref:tetratricopeptide repeat protein n=1 Tax=uncultured Brachyspira sp. TaxID=221953 RepID=UPI00259233AE|nr:tetratricopeptide repeat protein [uncultured Brachyspira sp.]